MGKRTMDRFRTESSVEEQMKYKTQFWNSARRRYRALPTDAKKLEFARDLASVNRCPTHLMRRLLDMKI